MIHKSPWDMVCTLDPTPIRKNQATWIYLFNRSGLSHLYVAHSFYTSVSPRNDLYPFLSHTLFPSLFFLLLLLLFIYVGPKACMIFPAALSIVLDGYRTNFFGVGCPAYCTSPSLGLMVAMFLLGCGLLVFSVSFTWPSVRLDFGFS
jgi:hypothetical protein